MEKYDQTVASSIDGKPIQGAQANIYSLEDPSNPTLATVYADEAGTVPMSQPILTDQLGYFAAYVPDGAYDVRVMAGSIEISRTNIKIVDSLALKQRALLVPMNEDSGTLPPAGERAGKLLGFDDDGNTVVQEVEALAGPPGPAGPANSTYTSKTEVAQAAETNRSYLLANAPLDAGYFQDLRGDYRAQVAADPTGILFIPVQGDPTGAQGVRARVLSGAVDVRWAGAKGDGSTDDTAAIVAADRVAAAFGKELFFPAPSVAYLTRQIPDARASWRGEGVGRTIIKGLVGSTAPNGFQPLVTWNGRDNIRVSDMTFDGSVSADPSPVTSANFNSYTGFGGPTINNGSNARFERVAAQNASWHGLRMYRVTGGAITDCTTRRTRGNFGDGILVLSSTDIFVDNCDMNDFTRGGGVADRFNESEPLCQRVWFTNCTVSNGHDGSVLYGGLEYNFGVWTENTVGITIDAVKSRNVKHRGVIAVSGQKTADYAGSYAYMSITNCEIRGSEAGITASSLVDLPVDAKISGNSVYGAQFGYSIQAKVSGDRFTLTGCHAEYNAASPVGQGFSVIVSPGLSAPPLIAIGDGCTVGRSAADMTLLTTSNRNVAVTADVGNADNNGAAMALNVTNLRTQDGSPIYMRWHGTVAHFISLTYVDWYCAFGEQIGGEVNVRGCKTRGINIGSASIVTFDLGTIVGGAAGQNIKVTAGLIYQNADTDISSSARIVLESTMGAQKPAVHIGGRLHQKDIAANGPIWQIEDAANWRTFFNSARWLSKSATATPNAWAEFRAGNFTASEVRADDAVTTLFNPVGVTGGAATYPGVTKIPMR